eukprot:CAMPEP_0194285618 /NCGR_PEP_ID=MMETSP0169-20130528/30589_1 /TAXON_ID=218684 /ORGANISM="Corethron pennatum, Strain L29A3" /LENGTH=476 /DNA_ID=CAMNT_0039031789 /DNA_START=27 /DNA_END=1457 /DNA_ORIENTATION=+
MASTDNFHQQAVDLIPATVRMISGCHSEQTSADVSNVASVAHLPSPAGRAGGACTSALLDILHRAPPGGLSFQDLLGRLRQHLAGAGFEQVPQLTSSRSLDVGRTPFHLVGGGGQRRAVLVGINYRGQSGELSGCHNDVFNMKKYIMDVHGFHERNIIVLVDDTSHPVPTRHRIIAALEALVSNSVAGDNVYFHYSGHGGLLAPEANLFKLGGGGDDGYDETLYPLDHTRAGQIRDYSLFNRFVRPMAAGVTVTCVMDCCHSGSVLDLPYSFQPTPGGGIRSVRNFDSLSNLAFLYVLAGGLLPPSGFGDVAAHIGDRVGGDMSDYTGAGIAAEAQDDEAYEGGDPDVGDFADGDGAPDDFGPGGVPEDPGGYEMGGGDRGFGGAETGGGEAGEGYGMGEGDPGFGGFGMGTRDVEGDDGGPGFGGFGMAGGEMGGDDGGFGMADLMGGDDNDPGVDCDCLIDSINTLLETTGDEE